MWTSVRDLSHYVQLELTLGERDGKRALIIRDAQHEYAFIESAVP